MKQNPYKRPRNRCRNLLPCFTGMGIAIGITTAATEPKPLTWILWGCTLLVMFAMEEVIYRLHNR